VWSEEFNTWLREELQNYVTGDGDIVGTIEAMNAKMTELNDKYGVGK
jgi:hypothetical protein